MQEYCRAGAASEEGAREILLLNNQKGVPGSWGQDSEVESLSRMPQVLGPVFSSTVFIRVSHRRELEPKTLCEARVTV